MCYQSYSLSMIYSAIKNRCEFYCRSSRPSNTHGNQQLMTLASELSIIIFPLSQTLRLISQTFFFLFSTNIWNFFLLILYNLMFADWGLSKHHHNWRKNRKFEKAESLQLAQQFSLMKICFNSEFEFIKNFHNFPFAARILAFLSQHSYHSFNFYVHKFTRMPKIKTLRGCAITFEWISFFLS